MFLEAFDERRSVRGVEFRAMSERPQQRWQKENQ
jgi:hypothetical protein